MAKSNGSKSKGSPEYDDEAGPSTSQNTTRITQQMPVVPNRDREEMKELGFTAEQLQWIQNQMRKLTLSRDILGRTEKQSQAQGHPVIEEEGSAAIADNLPTWPNVGIRLLRGTGSKTPFRT